jgi:hypothetical protein
MATPKTPKRYKKMTPKEFEFIRSMLDNEVPDATIRKITKRSWTVLSVAKQVPTFEEYKKLVYDLYSKPKSKEIVERETLPTPAPEPASITHKLLGEILTELISLNTLIREAGKSKKFRLF